MMPQDAEEQEEDKVKAKKPRARGFSSTPQPWLKIPAPIKRIFDRFPLQTLAANQLPGNMSEARDEHVLFIFASDDGAKAGRPSPNPSSLKWQTFLHFQGIKFRCVSSSNHASSTGALPVLVPAQTGSELSIAVPPNKILPWVRSLGFNGQNRHDAAPETPQTGHRNSENDISKEERDGFSGKTNGRYDVYMSLLDNPIRSAYLYALYLSPLNFDSVAAPLYIQPATVQPLVRFILGQQLRNTAQRELLKQSKVIDAESLYRESDKAFYALSILLGGDRYFFGAQRPQLFDASVFAYTNILLDWDLRWQETRMMDDLRAYENLTAHRKRILMSYYGPK